MSRSQAGRQRRWGISGGASILVHLFAAVCAVMAVGSREVVLSRTTDYRSDPMDAIGVDVVEAPVEARTTAEVPGPRAPTAPVRAPHHLLALRARPRPAATVVEPPAAPEVSSDQAEAELETARETETTASPDHGPMPETLAAETAPIGAAGGTLGASTVSASPRLTTAAQTSEPSGSTEVTATEARYLRTYESFPSLPRSLWGSGRVYDVLAQVCVSADGGVSGVSIRNGAAPELDRVITATVASWRYRPRLVAGAARPFCHLMKFVYTTR
jgi:hypothetical protein